MRGNGRGNFNAVQVRMLRLMRETIQLYQESLAQAQIKLQASQKLQQDMQERVMLFEQFLQQIAQGVQQPEFGELNQMQQGLYHDEQQQLQKKLEEETQLLIQELQKIIAQFTNSIDRIQQAIRRIEAFIHDLARKSPREMQAFLNQEYVELNRVQDNLSICIDKKMEIENYFETLTAPIIQLVKARMANIAPAQAPAQDQDQDLETNTSYSSLSSV